MRMWMVDPKIMCRKHLLGEHLELHMLAGCINNCPFDIKKVAKGEIRCSTVNYDNEKESFYKEILSGFLMSMEEQGYL